MKWRTRLVGMMEPIEVIQAGEDESARNAALIILEAQQRCDHNFAPREGSVHRKRRTVELGKNIPRNYCM